MMISESTFRINIKLEVTQLDSKHTHIHTRLPLQAKHAGRFSIALPIYKHNNIINKANIMPILNSNHI